MMCSDRVRYFRIISKGEIYVFDLINDKLLEYGFKPYHKRKRFKDPKLLHLSPHFFLLSKTDLITSDPLMYLRACRLEEKELKVGDYL